MADKQIENKLEILKEAEKCVDQIFLARSSPSQSVTGESARIWNMIEEWGLDHDQRMLKQENKGYFVSVVAMILSAEKEAIKMCMVSMKKSSRKGSKWEKTQSKLSKTKIKTTEEK